MTDLFSKSSDAGGKLWVFIEDLVLPVSVGLDLEGKSDVNILAQAWQMGMRHFWSLGI